MWYTKRSYEPSRVLAAILALFFFAGFVLGRAVAGAEYDSDLSRARAAAQAALGESSLLRARASELEAALRDRPQQHVEETFMRICLADIGTQAACSCLWRKVEDDYTVGEFAKLQTTMLATHRLEGRLLDHLMVCLVTVR